MPLRQPGSVPPSSTEARACAIEIEPGSEGAGLEFVPIRKIGGPDFGLKAEAVWFTHNLGVTSQTDFLFVKDVRINRWTFAFSGTLSF